MDQTFLYSVGPTYAYWLLNLVRSVNFALDSGTYAQT